MSDNGLLLKLCKEVLTCHAPKDGRFNCYCKLCEIAREKLKENCKGFKNDITKRL